MKRLIDRIEANALMPVIRIDDAAQAAPLAAALIAGGLPCAEITFRTSAAGEAIRLVTHAFPDMLVGAGTVLTVENADTAIDAGAAFIVTPGLNPQVVNRCIERGCPVIPGVCTPTETEAAMAFGLTRLKFFPAQAAGGIKMIKAMSAPYGSIRFMPTGGIDPDNLHEYLSCPAVFACGGSWMAPPSLINAGRFDEIEKLTRQAVGLIKEIRK